VCHAKQIRPTEFRVSGSAAFGDLNDAQRFKLALRRRNCVTSNAVLPEVLMGDREFAVIFAAVACEFDLDASEHTKGGQAQGAVRGRFEHFDQLPSEPPVDGPALFHATLRA
jgi:hypothetical protein